jgi:hypothetical protein
MSSLISLFSGLQFLFKKNSLIVREEEGGTGSVWKQGGWGKWPNTHISKCKNDTIFFLKKKLFGFFC